MVNHGDDKIVYEVSCWEPGEMHAISIQKRYKVKGDYALMVQNAARTMYDLRAVNKEEWFMIDVKLPPCFTEILFSDGEYVFCGVINDLICNKAEMIKYMERLNAGSAIPVWWRMMPKGPREVYGIE
jgi:hypothetical protein